MIVSHRHRFIFFAVPKTATHTIRRGLEGHLAEDDWQQQQLFGKQMFPVKELAQIGHGHLSFKLLEQYMPSAQWHDYFKFAFVRNPYDRFVSTCAFLNRDNPGFARAPMAWMKRALGRPRFRDRVLVRPQWDMLCDAHEKLAMDWLGRYESLQASFDELCHKLDIPIQQLSVSNRSDHQSYADYYDDELRQQVYNFYVQDFTQFDYASDLKS